MLALCPETNPRFSENQMTTFKSRVIVLFFLLFFLIHALSSQDCKRVFFFCSLVTFWYDVHTRHTLLLMQAKNSQPIRSRTACWRKLLLNTPTHVKHTFAHIVLSYEEAHCQAEDLRFFAATTILRAKLRSRGDLRLLSSKKIHTFFISDTFFAFRVFIFIKRDLEGISTCYDLHHRFVQEKPYFSIY